MNFPTRIYTHTHNSILISENYDNHFSCNLQECDCYYELNDFEGSILVSNAEAAKCKTKIIDVPYCGPITLARLENSKSLGPKLSVLKKRFDTVKLI